MACNLYLKKRAIRKQVVCWKMSVSAKMLATNNVRLKWTIHFDQNGNTERRAPNDIDTDTHTHKTSSKIPSTMEWKTTEHISAAMENFKIKYL